jgi:hypothetical protein
MVLRIQNFVCVLLKLRLLGLKTALLARQLNFLRFRNLTFLTFNNGIVNLAKAMIHNTTLFSVVVTSKTYKQMKYYEAISNDI